MFSRAKKKKKKNYIFIYLNEDPATYTKRVRSQFTQHERLDSEHANKNSCTLFFV